MNAAEISTCAITLNFFGRLFIEPPDAHFIEQIREGEVFAHWPFEPTNEDAAEALIFLKKGVEAHDEAAQAVLLTEYAALFIGPDNAVPLWESVWTTKDKLLFDGPMFEVRAAYAKYGLASPNPDHEPDDHIGLEMSFLGGVMGCAATAMDEGDTQTAHEHLAMAAEFINAHLSQWSSAFFEAVANHEDSSFYKAVSVLCADTLDQAAHLLQPKQV